MWWRRVSEHDRTAQRTGRPIHTKVEEAHDEYWRIKSISIIAKRHTIHMQHCFTLLCTSTSIYSQKIVSRL